MALRWLVRRDGIVDLGVWSALEPSQLFIPLDVHVANVSRSAGLLVRKQNDRRAVEELTCALRRLRPDLVVERFASEAPPRYRCGPDWGAVRNEKLWGLLEKRLEEIDAYQGEFFIHL